MLSAGILMSRGEKLIGEIVDGSSRDIGVVANELLGEFSKGLPVNHLAALLASDEERVVKSGIWIVSELGKRARPLAEDVGRLLRHSGPYIRFFAIDSLLTTTDREQGHLVAGVIRLLNDDSEIVRQKALDFLVRASPAQLEGAASTLDLHEPREPALAAKLRWLLNQDVVNRPEIIDALRSASDSDRRFGAAAALRHRMLDGDVLALAESSPDPEVRGVVKSELAAGRRREEHESRFGRHDPKRPKRR
jgi:hypothetical protein